MKRGPLVSPLAIDAEPFDSAESAIAWAWAFRPGASSGAFAHRFVPAERSIPRPCEPADVLIVVDRVIAQYRLDEEEVGLIRTLGWNGPIAELADHPKWPLLRERLTFHLQDKGIVQRPGGQTAEDHARA